MGTNPLFSHQKTPLLPKTREEIAEEYMISKKTLYRWLIKHNIRLPPGLVKPIDLMRIYETFGRPGKSENG